MKCIVFLVAMTYVWSMASAAKTVYIPASWKSTGEVPWSDDRSKQSDNFILLWGEKSGTNPKSASGDAKFDPDDIIAQLEKLYTFYVHDMKFTPETGNMALYKIVVIITNTWNRAALNAWATGGSADGKVGVINIDPKAAAPGSWGLAHELGHVFQAFTIMAGQGLSSAAAGTFWETSAEYMAMQVYPDTAAGDLTRFLRTESLAYSSSRHHYGAWMLVQYLVDKHGVGVQTFNDIWNKAQKTEHPLETYKRIHNFTTSQMNDVIGEYAQHQVTYDYSNKAHFQKFINDVYGAGFINAYNGVPVDAVNQSAGHYAIPDELAPSDYGYNKIHLVPSSDGAEIKLHFKGHAESGAGWTYGFVALNNGKPRYGPLSQSADGTIDFKTQAGEKDVYFVVAGTPSSLHHYANQDGFTTEHRYRYEFRVSGAVPSGFEPDYKKPAATHGGKWHSNGGGWVDGSATVAATAYVGPRAAVYGRSTVSDNARIEGLAWVNNGGNVGGNAVVKDYAIVQGSGHISGSAVMAGDSEMGDITCSSGTYNTFNTGRKCDGKAGETDVNPKVSHFSDAELSIS